MPAEHAAELKDIHLFCALRFFFKPAHSSIRTRHPLTSAAQVSAERFFWGLLIVLNEVKLLSEKLKTGQRNDYGQHSPELQAPISNQRLNTKVSP